MAKKYDYISLNFVQARFIVFELEKLLIEYPHMQDVDPIIDKFLTLFEQGDVLEMSNHPISISMFEHLCRLIEKNPFDEDDIWEFEKILENEFDDSEYVCINGVQCTMLMYYLEFADDYDQDPLIQQFKNLVCNYLEPIIPLFVRFSKFERKALIPVKLYNYVIEKTGVDPFNKKTLKVFRKDFSTGELVLRKSYQENKSSLYVKAIED